MKDQLIVFETAKLAKEKGFKNKTPHKLRRDYYNHLGEINGDVTEYIKAYVANKELERYNTIDAPTQSLLQKWLREVHSIYISVDYLIIEVIDSKGVRFDWSIYNKNESIESKELIGLLTYEEALEKGLVEALKLI
tara:strand:+ start:1949 stop:2356 length:408 start_codon:yes stop_codon:yes gene_type:complete